MVSESAVTDADYSGRDCFHHKSDESRQGRGFLPTDQPTNPTTRPLAQPPRQPQRPRSDYHFSFILGERFQIKLTGQRIQCAHPLSLVHLIKEISSQAQGST